MRLPCIAWCARGRLHGNFCRQVPDCQTPMRYAGRLCFAVSAASCDGRSRPAGPGSVRTFRQLAFCIPPWRVSTQRNCKTRTQSLLPCVTSACPIWTPVGSTACFPRAITSMAKNKTPEPTTRDHSRCHWLRRLTLWPSSMSRIISDLQSRQYTGRCCALVWAVTLSSFLFRLQTGQETHPSDILIIPQVSILFNRFPPFLFQFSSRYTWFQVQINITKFRYPKYPGLK